MRWLDMQVGQLCLPTEQRDPQAVPDAPFKYIDISSVDKDYKTIVSVQELFGRDAPSRARKVVRAGDILVSTVRPNLNAVAIVPDDLDDQIASTGFCVLRPNTRIVKIRYLFYRTQTPEFVSFLTSHMRGANYPAVTDGVVKAAEIPLPPLSEQRQIVEILDQADALRKKRAEADAKAERILPALFIKMFGDPVTNPKGWKVSRLDAVVEIGTQLVDPNQPDYVDLPHIGGEDIEKDTGRILNPKTVRESGLRSDKFYFTRDHVLYCKIRPYLNKVAFPQFDGVCSADIYPLLPDRQQIKPFFLVALLRSDAFLSYVRIHSERLRMPKLNKEQLGGYEIFLPPIETQTIFENLVRILSATDQRRYSSRERLERLFATLLHRAFSGDLTAKWREVHMKELLAEMEDQATYLMASGTNDHRESTALQGSLFER